MCAGVQCSGPWLAWHEHNSGVQPTKNNSNKITEELVPSDLRQNLSAVGVKVTPAQRRKARFTVAP